MTSGLVRRGFDLDLKEFQKHEARLAEILGGESRIEVKTDEKALETGNVFIEYEQPSGRSGIATTEAEWWATYLPQIKTFVVVATDRMKELSRKVYRLGFRANGGDHDNYRGVKVPLVWLVGDNSDS